MKIQFAGANCPLYIIRAGQIIQIKGNKYSIGSLIKGNACTFTNHEVSIQEGDKVYLFSDGYADQIGGEEGDEKFMYHRFRELLLSIHQETMSNQKEILKSNLLNWKGTVEQLDDILIVGFEV